MQQRVDQRAAVALVVGGACPGMHHHPGGLVDDGEVVVLEDDVERNVFGMGPQRRGVGVAEDGDLLSTLQRQRGLAVDPLISAFSSSSNCCTRARLTSGICVAKNWSSR